MALVTMQENFHGEEVHMVTLEKLDLLSIQLFLSAMAVNVTAHVVALATSNLDVGMDHPHVLYAQALT
jgi:hypothetical protein